MSDEQGIAAEPPTCPDCRKRLVNGEWVDDPDAEPPGPLGPEWTPVGYTTEPATPRTGDPQ